MQRTKNIGNEETFYACKLPTTGINDLKHKDVNIHVNIFKTTVSSGRTRTAFFSFNPGNEKLLNFENPVEASSAVYLNLTKLGFLLWYNI